MRAHNYDELDDFDDFDDYDDEEPTRLRWSAVGPWEYALGAYAFVRGIDGPPWIVEIQGRAPQSFRTLPAARRAVEEAAMNDAFEVAPEFEE
jgi:hypothetical protein